MGEDMLAWWRMGGYGLYVWGSIGPTLALMLLESFTLWQRSRHDDVRATEVGE